MFSRLSAFGLLLAALVTYSAPATAAVAQQDDLIEALRAADTWLGSLDEQNYAKCFSTAAPIFQQSTTLKKWEAALRAVKAGLGKVRERSIVEVKAATKLPPNSPEGRYFVIKYATSFQKKKASELLTMMLTKKGTWQVAGYYVV